MRKKIAVATLGTLGALLVAAVMIVLHAHAEYRYCLTFDVQSNGFPTFDGHTVPASYSCSLHEWWSHL